MTPEQEKKNRRSCTRELHKSAIAFGRFLQSVKVPTRWTRKEKRTYAALEDALCHDAIAYEVYCAPRFKDGRRK